MFQFLSFITGLAPMLTQVANNITDLQKMKVKAQSDTELAEINKQIEAAHDRRAILIAEAGNRISTIFNATGRFLLAVPVIVFLWKWLFWDKVIGAFAGCAGRYGDAIVQVGSKACATFITDKVDDNTWWIILGIIGFYFAYDFGSKAFRK